MFRPADLTDGIRKTSKAWLAGRKEDMTDCSPAMLQTVKKPEKRRPSFWLRLLCGLACLCIAFVLLVILLPLGYEVPSFKEVRGGHRGSESILLDRHGNILQEQRTDSSARRLDWVALPMVSSAFLSTLINVEDRRFYQHHGVDWLSGAGALAGLLGSRSRGASTITMQLAAQLDKELLPGSRGRTYGQKWRQIRAARALEHLWSKEQILEAYLNLVSYRGELQGLAAAAGGLFGKQPHGLTDVESLVLTALIRSPNASYDQVGQRARALALAVEPDVSTTDIDACISRALTHPYLIRPQAALAPHVARRLFRENHPQEIRAPERVTCTLDRSLQQFAIDTLGRHLATVRAQNVHDGAVLVLDNPTGDVLAYVANTGAQGSAPYVDGAQALRQAGSILKPFVYGAALDHQVLTAASLIDDSPLDIPVSGGMYRPSNYDNLFHGPVTVRTALASSLNVPAVKALNLIGIETVLAVLRAAGIQTLQSAEFYGPSLALGSADVCLWELAQAYRCLANGGEWSAPRLKFDEPSPASRRVLTPEAAFIISDILNDRESRSRTFSLESPLATRFWTAVKTGTSKDMRDNWCLGYSDRYTVAVWTGNFSGDPMWNVSGITGAAPVWVDIMNRLHREQHSVAPQPPRGVVARAGTGLNSGREWFIRGTETAVLSGRATPAARIVYPAAGMVVAIDPDIPAEEQKMFFEAEPKDERLRWVLDGRSMGTAGSLLLWTPARGRHELALADASGQVLETVVFEVRGSTDIRIDWD